MNAKHFVVYLIVALVVALVTAPLRAAPPASSKPVPEPTNVVFEVSLPLLERMISRQVERQTPVQETILGTRVSGMAHTRGKIAPVLVASPNEAIIQLRLTGTTTSLGTQGQNGPATIHSSSYSNVVVRKNIVVGKDGLKVLPAEAEVQTRLNIHDVTARRRIVERIARRRVLRSQPQAESATAAKAEARLKELFDQEALPPLRQVQQMVDRKLRAPLAHQQGLPNVFRISTSADRLRVALNQCARCQLPAPTSVPVLAARHDLALALHESAITSLYSVFYTNRVITDKEFLYTAHLLTGADPRPLRVHARTPRWSVITAGQHPVTVHFDRGEAEIIMYLGGVRYDGIAFDGQWQITARYLLENTDSGPRLTRQGELTIAGEEQSRSGGESLDVHGILLTKFNAIFPPELAFNGLVPPTGGVWDNIRLLQLEQLDAENGWLVIGYQIPRPTDRVVQRPGTPRTVSQRAVSQR